MDGSLDASAREAESEKRKEVKEVKRKERKVRANRLAKEGHLRTRFKLFASQVAKIALKALQDRSTWEAQHGPHGRYSLYLIVFACFYVRKHCYY